VIGAKKTVFILLLFTILLIILFSVPAYAEGTPEDDGTAISFSADATVSGDAVVVSYEKQRDDITIKGVSWKWEALSPSPGGAGVAGAVAVASSAGKWDMDSNTVVFPSPVEGSFILSIHYSDGNGQMYRAKFDPVPVISGEDDSANTLVGISLEQSEYLCGDPLEITYEKMDNITVLSGWLAPDNDRYGAIYFTKRLDDGSSNPISLAEWNDTPVTLAYVPSNPGDYHLNLYYQDTEGRYHTAKSASIHVANPYAVNLNISGAGEDGSVEAGRPISLEYNIDGGEDDFDVRMNWIISLEDNFTLRTDPVITRDRSGTFEFTPNGQASYLGYTFSVNRNEASCFAESSPKKYRVTGGGNALEDLPGAIEITIDQNRVDVGDTVTATYRKLEETVTILDGKWQLKTNSPYPAAVAAGASAKSWDVPEQTEIRQAYNEGEIWLDLLYQDSTGTYFKASSEHVIVGDWKLITYNWSPDNATVTASRVSAIDPGIMEEETVQTYVSVRPPTEENEGHAYYRATFTNSAFNVNGACQKSFKIPSLSSMSTLILPSSLLTIESSVFSGDERIEAVLVPDHCNEICNNAFENCRQLKYIRIGVDTLIEDGAFNGCQDVVVDRTY
jgi:hypothetical protein